MKGEKDLIRDSEENMALTRLHRGERKKNTRTRRRGYCENGQIRRNDRRETRARRKGVGHCDMRGRCITRLGSNKFFGGFLMSRGNRGLANKTKKKNALRRLWKRGQRKKTQVRKGARAISIRKTPIYIPILCHRARQVDMGQTLFHVDPNRKRVWLTERQKNPCPQRNRSFFKSL